MKRLSQPDNNDLRTVNVADPTSAQDAATKNYVDTSLNAKVDGSTTLTVSNTAPASPSVGDIWVDTN